MSEKVMRKKMRKSLNICADADGTLYGTKAENEKSSVNCSII